MDKIEIQCVEIHTWVIIKKSKEVITMAITVVVTSVEFEKMVDNCNWTHRRQNGWQNSKTVFPQNDVKSYILFGLKYLYFMFFLKNKSKKKIKALRVFH